ncbi:MAG TPA: S24 family peptidase [Humidesulfovibrio sp.]|uniref:LexA family transcriptional regulator n=1 Tax=Humidesulfovibrio sp. TaxID=2910988 RepID=UPI002CF68C3B|nr:S24 family peptidase [Humidesulfovibrio sp.]HWR05152.1 S24 family peptidase [Humidesulfovibrio sp.]
MAKLKKKCDERLEHWFEEAMERIKKATGARTQVQLAEVLEVRQSSISDAKRRCSVPSDWFLKLYRSHGLNPNWLSDGQEPVYLNASRGAVAAENLLREAPASYGRANARGRVVQVSTMTGSSADPNVWAPQPTEDLSIPESYHRPELAVLRVDSAAMEPVILRGAFVGVDMAQRQHPDGDLCAVHFPHQGLLIRRVYYQDGQFVLRAEDKSHADLHVPAAEMAARTLGRVVWVMQNLNPLA